MLCIRIARKCAVLTAMILVVLATVQPVSSFAAVISSPTKAAQTLPTTTTRTVPTTTTTAPPTNTTAPPKTTTTRTDATSTTRTDATSTTRTEATSTTAASTTTTKPTTTTTKVQQCPASALNLVQNSSFEQVTGPSTPLAGSYISGQLGWNVDPATTKVPHWKTEVAGAGSFVSNATTVFMGSQWYPQTAFLGSKYAAMTMSLDYLYGFIGELSATTTVGATYVLSVQAKTSNPTTSSWFSHSKVALRLRNSTTHAESPLAVQTNFTQTNSWELISGTVTANAHYDQVVLRHTLQWSFWTFSLGTVFMGPVAFDDVHLCQIAAKPGWWTLGHSLVVGLVAVIAVGVLGGLGVGGWRKRKGTGGSASRSAPTP